MPGRVWTVVVAGLVCAVTMKGACAMDVRAVDCEKRVIYHSPQTPGYTSWAGVWEMPDGSVLASFTQATGPLEGWRQRAPEAILRQLPTAQQEIPAYDFTGLTQENLCLRSADGGTTWEPYASDTFSSALNGYTNGSVAVLADGTLLRTGWGQSLTYCDVRRTGFVQRSRDAGKTWGPPEYLSEDPNVQTFPTRIRVLRDGRVVVTGGLAPCDPVTWQWMPLMPLVRHCMWIGGDPLGLSWSEAIPVTPPDADFRCEEWDAAELEDGDLLAVFRGITYDAAGNCLAQDRRQSILRKQGDTWVPGPVTVMPFPHSGHPELLVTREGVILHVAPPGIHWTADRGATWHALDCPGTEYYPHAVQLRDGTILAIGHRGSDDAYGKTDQAIVMNRFRLQVE